MAGMQETDHVTLKNGITYLLQDAKAREKLAELLTEVMEKYGPDNPPPYPVTSVNNKTGAVTLGKSDVGLGNVANERQYSADNPPPYPVTSVNSKTGAVTLGKSDVGLGNVENVKQYSSSNPPPYPVTKVNNKTGDVTLGKSDVGLGNVDNVKQYSAENPPPISGVKLLEEANIPSTEATSYSCNWSNYDLLIICGCFYGNICETIVVPKGYFSTTRSERRVRINNAAYSRIYDVYKNGNNAVYILADQSETTAFGIQIYGVKNS